MKEYATLVVITLILIGLCIIGSNNINKINTLENIQEGTVYVR